MNHQFIVMWCCEGLECVADVTKLEQQNMWNTLKGNNMPKFDVNLRHLLLRARANSQRFYEIYSVTAQDGITAEDIEEMFSNDPQTAADTIRRLGYKIYSDRQTKEKVIT
jgi:hypothetical protein